MKSKLVVAFGVATALAVAVLVNCRTARAPSAPASEPVAGGAPSAPAPATPRPAESAAPSTTVAPSAPPASPPTTPKTGSEALAEKRGLNRPGTSPAVEAMKQFDRDEMLLFAQIQKRTGREPSPAVKEVIEARRAGATYHELWSLADVKLAGDAEMLLAVRGWLEDVVRPAEPGAPAAGPTAPQGTPLELGGKITPK